MGSDWLGLNHWRRTCGEGSGGVRCSEAEPNTDTGSRRGGIVRWGLHHGGVGFFVKVGIPIQFNPTANAEGYKLLKFLPKRIEERQKCLTC